MPGSTEIELVEVLQTFCAGFADHDADAVSRLFAPDSGLTVVTSEQPLLRGPDETRAFLDRYAAGSTTYSWNWDRHDVTVAGTVAWLLAEGTETATSDDGAEQHVYRMTMVFERRDDGWKIRHVHGSSPH